MHQAWLDRMYTKYFSKCTSPHIKNFLSQIPSKQAPRYYEVVEGIFRRIVQAKMNLNHLTPYFFDATANALAQNGFFHKKNPYIPPITLPNRHAYIDQFIQDLFPQAQETAPHFLDIGCGFPPLTTIESSKNLPHFKVTGADPAFYTYLVKHTSGNYACFDKERSLRFLWDYHGRKSTHSHWTKEKENTKKELLQAAAQLFQKQEVDGFELITNPIQAYQTNQLRFINGGFEDFTLEKESVDIARIFNVFLYYPDDPYRDNTLSWIQTFLKEDGYVLIGTNWQMGLNTCFTKYQKKNKIIKPVSIHISMDCFYPTSPWLFASMFDRYNEADQLTRWLSKIKSDHDFNISLNQRMRELLDEDDLFTWDNDHNSWSQKSPTCTQKQYEEKRAQINERLVREGFLDQAIKILQKQGTSARKDICHFLEIKL